MKYIDFFRRYYFGFFKSCDNNSLVNYEHTLKDIIDCGLHSDIPVTDEILILYEMVRDECVFRLSIIDDNI